MPIYNLSDLVFTSPFFSAMDCVLHKEQAIYCSSELTSGLRAYTEMRNRKVRSAQELKARCGEAWYKANIVEVNENAALDFARYVCKQAGGDAVINPGPLKVPGWDQREYLAFWEELIRTRVKAVRFNKNWQFSSGCTFEFVVATKLEIPTLDAEGSKIDFKTAVGSIQDALLKFDGFDTKKLQANLERLTKHSINLRELGTATKKISS
jgi:hypothetical protein